MKTMKAMKTGIFNRYKKNTSAFIALVFLAAAFVPLLGAPNARAAVNAGFSLTPASNTVTTGQNIVLNLNLDTGGNSVHAFKATINYSTSAFSSVSVATAAGSPFTSLPSADVASGGTIRIARYTTSASSTSGAVATITLKSNAVGSGALSFAHICSSTSDTSPCSAVTDASGANLLSGQSNTGYTIKAVPVATKAKTKKSSFGSIVSSITSAATPAPAAEETEIAENMTVVRLKIIDKAKKPIEGAVVKLGGQRATTASNGQVLFTELPAGKLKGSIEYKGKIQEFTIDVIEGSSFSDPQTAVLTFAVATGSSVWGKLLFGLGIVLIAAATTVFIYKNRSGGSSVASSIDPDIKSSGNQKPAAASSSAASKASKTIKRHDPLKPGIIVRPTDGV